MLRQGNDRPIYCTIAGFGAEGDVPFAPINDLKDVEQDLDGQRPEGRILPEECAALRDAGAFARS